MGCGTSASVAPEQQKTAEQLLAEQETKKRMLEDAEKARLAHDQAIAADAAQKWPALKPAVDPFVCRLCAKAQGLLARMAEDDKSWWTVQVDEGTNHGEIMGFLVRREFETWLLANQYEFGRKRAKYHHVIRGTLYDSGCEWDTYGTVYDAAYDIRKIFKPQQPATTNN